MTRNESMLQFQRRLIKVAMASPRMEAMKMFGIIYSNLEEFIQVRMPLDKHKASLFESFTETLELFDHAISTKFVNLYMTNTPSCVDALVQKLISDAKKETGEENGISDVILDAILKKIAPILRNVNLHQLGDPTPKANTFGLMLNNMYYHPFIVYHAAMKLHKTMADSEVWWRDEYSNVIAPSMKNLVWSYRASDKGISAPPVKKLTDDPIVNIERWINRSELAPTVIVNFNYDMTDQEDDTELYHIFKGTEFGENQFSVTITNPLLIGFNHVVDFLIDHTPGEVSEGLKYEKEDSLSPEIRGFCKTYSQGNDLFIRTPNDVIPKLMKFMDIEQVNEILSIKTLSEMKAYCAKVRHYEKPDPILASAFLTIYRTDPCTYENRDWVLGGSNVKFIAYLACILHDKLKIIVELRARGSELNNVNLCHMLSILDVDVRTFMESPGVKENPEFKTHAKLWRISFADNEYIISSTGNFQDVSQHQFSDCYYCKKFPIQRDADREFIRHLNIHDYIPNPGEIKDTLLKEIDKTIAIQTVYNRTELMDPNRATIRIKCNHLTDPEIINALILAAEVGVFVEILVRTTCTISSYKKEMLHFAVRSVAGRYLEHDRFYIFDYGDGRLNGYLSSADLMDRNLNKRFELFHNTPYHITKRLTKIFDAMFTMENNPKAGFYNFEIT